MALTTTDLKLIQEALKPSFDAVKYELRVEMQTQGKALRNEMQAQGDTLRGEMHSLKKDLQAEIKQSETRVSSKVAKTTQETVERSEKRLTYLT